jgi:hypothetical protein
MEHGATCNQFPSVIAALRSDTDVLSIYTASQEQLGSNWSQPRLISRFLSSILLRNPLKINHLFVRRGLLPGL